jgi:hypothetical protein
VTARDIPDLQIPFSKPKHVGYCLSCYRGDGKIYSLPIEASTDALLKILTRSNVINSELLTKPEFAAVFPLVVGAAELCWHEDLEFQITGSNLPPDWRDC